MARGETPITLLAMLFAAAVLLHLFQVADRPRIAFDVGREVPTFVVPAGSITVCEAAPPRWVAADAGVGGEELHEGRHSLEVRWVEAPKLEQEFEAWWGVSGEFLEFDVAVDANGRAAVEVEWECNDGVLIDVHGEVHLEAREAGTGAPLRMSYRLTGVAIRDGRVAVPVEVNGTREVDLFTARWDATIREPRLPDATPFGWRDVWADWIDGSPRSRGRVDAHGRRIGTWTTWSEDGIRESVSNFRRGVRHGEWNGFTADGALAERGRFEDGSRVGRWVEVSLDDESERFTSGRYTHGVKSGEWRTVWGDGSLCERGRYVDGRRSGFWRTYEPRLDLFELGTYVDGMRDGYWRTYRRDGSRVLSGVYVRDRRVGEWASLRADGTPFGGAIECW